MFIHIDVFFLRQNWLKIKNLVNKSFLQIPPPEGVKSIFNLSVIHVDV